METKQIFKKFAETVLRFKIFQNRSLGLIGLFTSTSVIYLLVDRLGLTVNLNPWMVLIVGFILLIGFGWLDVKLGLLKMELDIGNQQNPQLMEIITRLKKIERGLEHADTNRKIKARD